MKYSYRLLFIKVTKGLGLTIVSYLLLKISIASSYGVKFIIDTSLMSMVSRGSKVIPFNLLDTFQYGKILIVLAIFVASCITSLIGRKLGFDKKKVLFSFFVLWFAFIFIFPSLIGR